MTKNQAKIYKALTKRIESFGDNPPIELLNGRFNFFNAILINNFKGKGIK